MKKDNVPLSYDKALLRARKLCASRECCKKDILVKLHGWGMSAGDTEKIIESLVTEHFIDERRYALAAAKDKSAFNKWGTFKIRQFLRGKGIPDEYIREALEGIDPESQREMAEKILAARNRNIRDVPPLERKARLFRLAQSRGFETEMALGIIEKLVQSSN